MKIILSASNFQLVKVRLYKLYDLFVNELEQYDLKKSAFLNMCAISFNYRNWDDLKRQSTTANKYGKNTLIFTPSNITEIANTLRNEIGVGDIDTNTIIACIGEILTDEEQAQFKEVTFPSMPDSDTPIFLELGPKTIYETNLLDYLWPHINSTLDVLVERYTKHVKSLREGKTKDEIINSHLDIYKVKGVSAESIFRSLLTQGYLSEVDGYYTITDRADWYCRSKYTDDYGEQWQQWFGEFKTLFKQIPHKTLSDDWKRYIQFYRNDVTPSNAVDILDWSTHDKNVKAKIEGAVSELNLVAGKRVVHINPVLRLSNSDHRIKASNVRLSITSEYQEANNLEFKLRKPYPNKLYIGAYNTKASNGCYITVPDKMNSFSMLLLWQLDNGMEIEHYLKVNLHPSKFKEGFYYSSDLTALGTNYTPLSLFPVAFYNICEYYDHYNLDTINEVALNNPRNKMQLYEVNKAGKKVILKEELNLIYQPMYQGLRN